MDLFVSKWNIVWGQKTHETQLAIAKELVKEYGYKLVEYAINNSDRYLKGNKAYSLKIIPFLMEQAKQEFRDYTISPDILWISKINRGKQLECMESAYENTLFSAEKKKRVEPIILSEKELEWIYD